MSPQHVDSFLDGEVYISNILEFRKGEPGSDKIFDQREGECTFHLRELGTVYWKIDRAELNDVFIFCVTAQLKNKSLFWAKESKKIDHCVMVIGLADIVGEVTNATDLDFVGRGYCDYTNRDIIIHSEVEKKDEYTRRALFYKPVEYDGQHEHRVVWFGDKKGLPYHKVQTKSSAKKIKVEFHNTDESYFNLIEKVLNITSFKVEFYSENGELIKSYDLPYIDEFYTPYIYIVDGEKKLVLQVPKRRKPNEKLVSQAYYHDDMGWLIYCCDISRLSLIKFVFAK